MSSALTCSSDFVPSQYILHSRLALLAQGTDPSCQSTSRSCASDPSTPPCYIPRTELRDPQVVAYPKVPHTWHTTRSRQGTGTGLMGRWDARTALFARRRRRHRQSPGKSLLVKDGMVGCAGWEGGRGVTGCRAVPFTSSFAKHARAALYVRFQESFSSCRFIFRFSRFWTAASQPASRVR